MTERRSIFLSQILIERLERALHTNTKEEFVKVINILTGDVRACVGVTNVSTQNETGDRLPLD